MKFINKHKSSIVGLLIFIVVLIAFLLLKNTVMFDENQAIYGNRLDGQEKVKITKEQETKIQEAVANITRSIKVKQNGKIINVFAETNAETSLDEAKTIGDKALSILTDEQKAFFDIQILIENKDNTDQYPIIGYKHQNRDSISWTKDRAKTEG